MSWNVKKIVIEEGVTSIGNSAFAYCRGLISITIPDSVTSIGEWAFDGCTSLPSITISSSVTSIEFGTFKDCSSLTSITIPDGVTSIGAYAFSKCSSLTSITIPDSVTSIKAYAAFNGCTSLKTISLSCGSILKRSDFSDQANLVSYTSHILTKTAAKAVTCTENGNKEYWTCEHCKKYFLSNDTNPETAKAVEQSEFIIPASHKLTKVEAKDATCSESGNKEYWTCEHCGKYFLSDDTNPETAKAVELSETITPALKHKNATTRGASKPDGTKPGYSGDRYCPDCDKVVEKGYTYWIEDNLTWKLYEDGTLNISGTGAMKNYGYSNNRSPVFWNTDVTSIVIEEGVTSIGNEAFHLCRNLISITIPKTLKSIGNNAFYDCTSLTSVTIPGNVESIGESAFYYCDNLTDVTLQDGVKSIGDAAFIWCNNLTNIVLPNSMTSIGYYAFKDCTSLTSITIPDSVTSIGNDAFYNCSSLKTISLSCKSSLKRSNFGEQADLVSYTNQHILTKTAAKAATCTENGNKEYWTCEHCKKYFLSDDTNPETAKAVEQSETVIPASHKLTKVEAKAATCTENGNKEYWTCEHCGKYFLSDDTNPETAKAVELSETVIPASHKLTKVEAKDATCTEDGNKEYWTCEHCKKYFLSDDTNPETAKAVELSETVIPALVQVATTTTPIKCVYGQDMSKIDLRDYVKNTDVVGEVTVKVATGSTLPDGMKLDGSKLSGKPAKAYEDGKEVTFTFTAENGNTANLTLLFLVAKADPTVEVAVSGDSHTEGDLVSELKLILSENSTKGVVELVSEIKALVAGKNAFTWKFTPEDENNYNMVTGTVVVNAQTTTTTTTKATTTTTKATTTTKPSKTTTTKATTTTKPSKTTTTKATTTTKPSKTTTTKATTTTKPSKTTTTNATTTNTAIPSYGDVNLDGKVDIVDAIFLNKYLATLIQFSDAQVANADCYQDGVLNDQDTTALMQFIILLIDDLPVQPTEK
ncbi:MAG: leucine-rich repeat protein [Ruminococcus sp.]|nr:leucine-rich repeat protein [Ruminococcus sp.]